MNRTFLFKNCRSLVKGPYFVCYSLEYITGHDRIVVWRTISRTRTRSRNSKKSGAEAGRSVKTLEKPGSYSFSFEANSPSFSCKYSSHFPLHKCLSPRRTNRSTETRNIVLIEKKRFLLREFGDLIRTFSKKLQGTLIFYL